MLVITEHKPTSVGRQSPRRLSKIDCRVSDVDPRSYGSSEEIDEFNRGRNRRGSRRHQLCTMMHPTTVVRSGQNEPSEGLESQTHALVTPSSRGAKTERVANAYEFTRGELTPQSRVGSRTATHTGLPFPTSPTRRPARAHAVTRSCSPRSILQYRAPRSPDG